MSGFTKPCIYCNREIRLSNDSGRWLPYNPDNTAHECKGKQSQTQQTQQQQKQIQEQQNKSQLSLESLDIRLKILEAKISEVFGTN